MIRDLTGQRIGNFVVLKFAKTFKGYAYWECQCTCGSIEVFRGKSILIGSRTSCGCLALAQMTKTKREKGRWKGLSQTKLYSVWRNMMDRCYNPVNARYGDYGGRGILVCAEWHDFQQFLTDLGERPDGLTLDRRDNNKGYGPENCRWATRVEQARNRRITSLLTLCEATLPLATWCEIYGQSLNVVEDRIRRYGWEPWEALTIPVSHSYYSSQLRELYCL